MMSLLFCGQTAAGGLPNFVCLRHCSGLGARAIGLRAFVTELLLFRCHYVGNVNETLTSWSAAKLGAAAGYTG